MDDAMPYSIPTTIYLRLIFVLVLLQSAASQASASASTSKEDEEEDDDVKNYLYSPLGEDADPVIEYKPKDGEDPNHPDFIFGPNNGPRVVEFYAPWCPHCQHFRDHYINFGDQVQSLAKQQPEKVDIKVYAVSCTVYKPLCKYFGVHAYPGLRLFTAGATNATAEASYWSLHPFSVLKELGIQTTNLNLDLPKTKKRISDKSRPEYLVDDDLNLRTKQNVYDDAWKSFHFSMENGVFMNDSGPLSNNTQTHLRDWLDLLKLALPPSWQIQTLLKALLDNFNDIVQSESELNRILKLHPPPKKNWSPSCTHGNPIAGYTCGLWELFHIVTVGTVEFNMMISTDDGQIVIQTEDTASKIRNFVESFFGCEVCRTNFLQAFDTCSFNRCSRLSNEAYSDVQWLQLPVWLWETHNAVNVRLLNEKAERENWKPKQRDEIDKQWPSRSACPKCWDAAGAWDDKVVYKFLRLEYW